LPNRLFHNVFNDCSVAVPLSVKYHLTTRLISNISLIEFEKKRTGNRVNFCFTEIFSHLMKHNNYTVPPSGSHYLLDINLDNLYVNIQCNFSPAVLFGYNNKIAYTMLVL
jgi:hypothetical protein